ncbi:MAG: sortase-associated OmpA-like protein PdsO [bacterium]
MKTKQMIVMLVVMIIGSSSFAKQRDTLTEERRGVAVGAVIGGVLGGPFGAGVGAMVGGGLIGKLVGVNRINRDQEVEMKQQASSHRRDKAEMQAVVANLGVELDRMIDIQTGTWNRREHPIQFRTGSSRIETHYESQLYEIALNLSQNQETSVLLSGFADRRGKTEHNQKLSEQRVGAVKAFLLSQGVLENQIQEKAFGETRPLKEQETSENNFFDRRVVLEFSTDVASQVATR